MAAKSYSEQAHQQNQVCVSLMSSSSGGRRAVAAARASGGQSGDSGGGGDAGWGQKQLLQSYAGTVVKPLLDPLVSHLVSTQPADPVAAAIQYLHDVQRRQNSDVLADNDDVAPPAAAAKETASSRSTLPTDEEWFRSIFASENTGLAAWSAQRSELMWLVTSAVKQAAGVADDVPVVSALGKCDRKQLEEKWQPGGLVSAKVGELVLQLAQDSIGEQQTLEQEVHASSASMKALEFKFGSLRDFEDGLVGLIGERRKFN